MAGARAGDWFGGLGAGDSTGPGGGAGTGAETGPLLGPGDDCGSSPSPQAAKNECTPSRLSSKALRLDGVLMFLRTVASDCPSGDTHVPKGRFAISAVQEADVAKNDCVGFDVRH